MLTPAEEVGLSGLALASRARRAFYAMPEPRLLELMEQIRAQALVRHVVYLRDGTPEPVHIMACPLTVLADQMAYVHSVTLTIHNALKRLVELYMHDFAVREILRLSADEEQWLWECYGPSHREHDPIFGRHDAAVDFISAMWKDSLKFMEPNMTGIGGMHMVPMAEQILASIVFPAIHKQDPELHLEIGRDIRDLLMQDVRDHLEALGRPARSVCFVEPKYASSGIDEQEDLARYYHDRYGLRVMHADPSELTLDRGEVRYGGEIVDVAYRDYSVADLQALAKTGVDVTPMRTLLRENRVISSISAELDQKSCWEVFTDPVLAQKYFSAEERQVFRRHVLWTRIVSDRRTSLPDGREGSLLEYLRSDHESIVLKPNRSYGGEGVVLGQGMTRAEWDAALEVVLADSNRWVAQQLTAIPVCEFPIAGADGRVHVEPFYAVMGFAATRYGMAVLGRASQKHVVNVAQRGGMCVVAQGSPPARLVGPQG
jgi:hypothetical protein